MKRFLLVIMVVWSNFAWANFDLCPQFFVNTTPVVRSEHSHQFELCNARYASLYDGDSKLPIMVFAKITPQMLAEARTLSRKGLEFETDTRVPSYLQAYPEDYTRSGYDRGHMIGNAFMDRLGQRESFLMTNISPQLPRLNREVFAKIEKDTRAYVRRTGHEIYLIVGVSNLVTFCHIHLRNQVCVPDNLWMAIFDPQTGKSWAHWMHQAGNAQIIAPISIQELNLRLGRSTPLL